MRLSGPTNQSITANTNDWAPTDFNTSDLLIVTSSGTWDVTGMAAAGRGRIVQLLVHSGTITLKNNSGSSVAGNRFAIGSDLVLTAGYGCTLFYDRTNTVWRALGRTAAPVTPVANLVVKTQEFLASGTFTPTAAMIAAGGHCEVTLVGGGGAGGGAVTGNRGGGGGGGGQMIRRMLAGVITPQTVTIGAGGTGVSGANGNNGTDSTFGALLTAVGGGGGGGNGSAGADGACGGGGSASGSTANVPGGGGGGLSEHGYNADGTIALPGGKGSVGGVGGYGASTSTKGGDGGTGVEGFGGGGGGGGNGTFFGRGASGGGNGAGGTGNGNAATANTGSGGGGAISGGSNQTGGAGGSGYCRVTYWEQP